MNGFKRLPECEEQVMPVIWDEGKELSAAVKNKLHRQNIPATME